MTIRPFRSSDKERLEAMQSGFPYPALTDPMLEGVWVVADDQDRPVMALAARRLVELYLYVDPEFSHPAARLHALRRLHDSAAVDLRRLGYREAEAFLPPEIERKFGRRLMKTFDCVKNWVSYCIRF